MQILLLCLLDVDNLVIIQREAVHVGVWLLADYLTCDDKRFVAEHTREQFHIPAVVGRTEILHKVNDNLSAGIVDV